MVQRSPELGPQIFRNLFNLCPEVLPMFSFSTVKDLMNSTELKEHSGKVVSALSQIITRLPFTEETISKVQRLAKTHRQYKVKPQQINAFGAALIKTVEDLLG